MIQLTYDYVIVGAGSAGGFLALRLSEDPSVSVLLLEAGPPADHWTTRMPAAARYTFTGGPRNWCFETEPEPYMNGRRIFQPRGKTLGGSSSLNGMVFVRGHPEDYANWVAAGADGWSYPEVFQHFLSIERYMSDHEEGWRGDSGPVVVRKMDQNHPIELAFLEACQQIGIPQPKDYNGSQQEGATRFDANIDRGRRSGTARACIRPAMKRRNCTVVTDVHVTKVMIEYGRAAGVRYRYQGRDLNVRASREVILSAGAFQTPQLLMLSGIGPAAHLQEHGIEVVKNLPGVGQNLQDHLEVHLMYDCPHKGMSMNKWLAFHRRLRVGMQWMLFKNGIAAHSLSKVGAFLRSDASATYPDIQYHFWPYLLEGWSPPPGKDGFGCSAGPVRSNSRGWVKLRSPDPFDAPRIQLNGLSDPWDLEVFRASINLMRYIVSQKAFDFCRGVEVSPGADVTSNEALDEYVRNNANSAYHPCGTARMGRDRMAVTDSKAQVLGIEKLRVADASIMPTITNGNINAPCMMIGEKVARMIIEANSPASLPEIQQPQPAYAPPQPETEQPQPEYEQPQPEYGQPQPEYAQPQPETAQPQPQYEQPQPEYAQPQPEYAQQQPEAAQPQPEYAQAHPEAAQPQTVAALAVAPLAAQPQSGYAQPQPEAAQPQPEYAQPQPETAQPQPEYAQAQPLYEQPQPEAAQPQPLTAQPQPEHAQAQPGATQPQPEVQPQPEAAQPQPEVQPQPGTAQPQPEHAQAQQPGATQPQPEVQPQPEAAQPQPEVQPQPGTAQPQPEYAQAQPEAAQPQPEVQPQPAGTPPQLEVAQAQPPPGVQPQPAGTPPQLEVAQSQPGGPQPQPGNTQPNPGV